MQISKSFTWKAVLGIPLIVILFKTCFSQAPEIIQSYRSIQALDASKNHYQELGKLDSNQDLNRKDLDQIRFPKKKYR